MPTQPVDDEKQLLRDRVVERIQDISTYAWPFTPLIPARATFKLLNAHGLPTELTPRRIVRDVMLCAEYVAKSHLRDLDEDASNEWTVWDYDRRVARRAVMDRAWLVSGHIADLAGRQRRDRDNPAFNAFGRWLHWASDDFENRRRTEGALYACVDMVRSMYGPTPHAVPKLQKPPDDAVIVNPTRTHRWLSGISTARPALLALLSIATAVITFLAKVW